MEQLQEAVSKEQIETIQKRRICVPGFSESRISFSDVAAEWLYYASPLLKDSSIARYQTVLVKYLIPIFGSKDVSAITRDEVALFLNKLLMSEEKDGTGLMPKTVSGILSVMKNIMGYARQFKGISVIDFEMLSIKQSQKKLRVFSNFEQNILNEYLLDNITLTKLGVLLCLYTGLRIGEICALKWGDVSFDERKIHIDKTLQRIQKPDENGRKTQIIITSPKSECSVRDIPLPDKICRVMTQAKCPSECFFLTGLENVFIEPRTLENRFNRILNTCGISNATMHTCRHTFATRCIELGFDMKTLSEILGHASVAITMNRYVHPSMEFKHENMSKLSVLLDGTSYKKKTA